MIDSDFTSFLHDQSFNFFMTSSKLIKEYEDKKDAMAYIASTELINCDRIACFKLFTWRKHINPEFGS